VLVLIFHSTAPTGAGPLVGALAEARGALAQRQCAAFLAAGADAAQVVAGPPDGLTFGERLAAGIASVAGTGHGHGVGGLVVLGSGSIPLATAADLRRFVEVAAGPGGHAIANNRYSADVVAISRVADLAGLPPLPADNALPRWLEERAGVAVTDLRSRWRLGIDIDTPLDLMLLRDPAAGALHTTAPLFGERLEALTDVLSNRRAELLVAGRVSATTLTWLQRGVACRVRALVEERGLKAASQLAQSRATAGATNRLAAGPTTNSRPPRSVLGELLERDGPEALAAIVARLADAAVIDSRVLMGHRFGPSESSWPAPEDRFASDLLLTAAIANPWLRALTASAASAASAPTPILLGGHTLVNGGLRLLAQRARAGAR
jgi:CTP:molybdopterin cytidylyltransferase MocA